MARHTVTREALGLTDEAIFTNGALDRPVGEVYRPSALIDIHMPAMLLSDLRKGDTFYELRGVSGLPRRTAASDAYQTGPINGHPYERVWAVDLEPF